MGCGADLNIQDHEMATPLHIVTHLTGVGLNPFNIGQFDLPGTKTPDFLKVGSFAYTHLVLRNMPRLSLYRVTYHCQE